MVTTVVQVDFPVDESQVIRKMRLTPEQGTNGKRISIVTGIHGDELEGQYVCYRLSRYIQEHIQYLIGTIVNPLSGTVIDELRSPVDGWLFTIREYPVVNEGSLIGRILR